MARVKRFVDSVKYSGPIVVASDCTKVRKRLNFSTQHGCHVLGTVFDLADVEVDDEDDLDEIVERTIKKKAHATQTRAILAKVFPFDQRFSVFKLTEIWYYRFLFRDLLPSLSHFCLPMERKTPSKFMATT